MGSTYTTTRIFDNCRLCNRGYNITSKASFGKRVRQSKVEWCCIVNSDIYVTYTWCKVIIPTEAINKNFILQLQLTLISHDEDTLYFSVMVALCYIFPVIPCYIFCYLMLFMEMTEVKSEYIIIKSQQTISVTDICLFIGAFSKQHIYLYDCKKNH